MSYAPFRGTVVRGGGGPVGGEKGGGAGGGWAELGPGRGAAEMEGERRTRKAGMGAMGKEGLEDRGK